MAQDVLKGRRTEIEFINGYIVDKGRMMGIPTPAHEKLVGLVRKLERGEIGQIAPLTSVDRNNGILVNAHALSALALAQSDVSS